MGTSGGVDGGGTGHGVPRAPAVFVTDAAGAVVAWNRGAQALFGRPSSRAVGRPAAKVLAAAGFGVEWADLTAGGGCDGARTTMRGADGARLPVTVSCSEVEDGRDGPAGHVVICGPAGDDDLVLRAVAQSTIALDVFDSGLRPAYANDAARRLRGAPGPDAGEPPDVAGERARVLRRAAERGRPLEFTRCAPASGADTSDTLWTTSAWPVRDGASGRLIGTARATRRAGADRSTAQHRLALLSEAGARIGTTLDVRRTAAELCEFAVPRLADFVSVDLLDSVFLGAEPPPGPVPATVTLRRVAHHSLAPHVPEAVIGLGETDLYPAFTPAVRCLVSGRPVVSAYGDADVVSWLAQHDARKKSVEDFAFRSMMAVPLRARGHTMGVVTFLRRATSRAYEPDDAAFAEEVADRAALCLDNARRYMREHGTAVALQRSLLPHRSPGSAAVSVAHRYLPADSQAGVGGDWFDVIPLSGSRVALVAGDVVGHGIEAAAAMGRLRTAVRTLADVDLPPDELLTHLDDLVTHMAADDARDTGLAGHGAEAGAMGATCLYAVYDPVSCVCALASAGHPPPVVVLPDGTVETAQVSPGPPLGVGGLPFETAELDLPEGSLVALYTDGLIAGHGHDLDAGLDALRRVLTGALPSLDDTCDTVLASPALGGSGDDVALLIARTRALDNEQVAAWALPCDPAVVAQARSAAARQLAAWDLEELAFVTELAVSELVTNAIRYGQPPISLRLIRDRSLICEVSDGSNTAPHMRRARTFDEGGRGLHLVAQLCRSWGARHAPAGKTIWAEQALPPL